MVYHSTKYLFVLLPLIYNSWSSTSSTSRALYGTYDAADQQRAGVCTSDDILLCYILREVSVRTTAALVM